jgi:hypothetical protein
MIHSFRIFFCTIFIITALEIAIPAWVIYSSRSTLYYFLLIFLDQFVIRMPIPRSIKWWDMLKGSLIYWWISIRWRSTLYHTRDYCIPRILWYRFRPTEVICRRGISPGFRAEGLFDFINSVNLAAHPHFLAPRTSLYTGTSQWIVQLEASFRSTELASSGEIPLHTWKTTLWYRNRLTEWEGLQLWKAPTTLDGPDSFRELTAMTYLENFCVSRLFSQVSPEYVLIHAAFIGTGPPQPSPTDLIHFCNCLSGLMLNGVDYSVVGFLGTRVFLGTNLYYLYILE